MKDKCFVKILMIASILTRPYVLMAANTNIRINRFPFKILVKSNFGSISAN